MEQVEQLLDCIHTNPNAVVHYYAPNVILNIHSDALYLSAGCELWEKPRMRLFFLGSLQKGGTPIKLNRNITITCAILKLVAASAAEAELGALFLNVQEARILQLILYEMGHPQP